MPQTEIRRKCPTIPVNLCPVQALHSNPFDMPSVLIIIVTYNGAGHIRRCLTSYDVNNPDVSCLIADNGSTDDTLEIIKKEYPEIKLVENGKNLGFGAANNIGLRYALDQGYDYVYLLNQDAWIDPKDIDNLIEIAEKNQDFGLISPLQVYAGKKKIDSNFSEKITKEIKDDFIISDNNPKDLYEVKNRSFQAAHWLIKSSALKTAGGFSPSFFLYGEDTNLCRRFEFHNIKLGIAPRIMGVHNRENRLKSPSLEFKRAVINWKQTVSDPRLSLKSVLKHLAKELFNTFIDYPVKFTPAFLKFIAKTPGLWRNCKVSMREKCAFLK